jgi:hypothetical protein
MFQYRVTKYDPRFRDASGAYMRDDWTSIDDIGRSFGGSVLTDEEYQRVENAYVEVAIAFLREAGVNTLTAIGVENGGASPFAPLEGTALTGANLADVIRRVLRAEFWCRLEGDNCFVHIGYDYYMYVGVPISDELSRAMARELGLFVEPFVSPYYKRPG